MAGNNAIAVLCIGSPDYYKLTRPSIEYYCKNHGIDFIELKDTSNISKMYKIPITDRHNFVWEKFQVFELANSYDFVCSLDADILIKREADNIFDECRHRNFNAVLDGLRLSKNAVELFVDRFQCEENDIFYRKESYYNGGLFISDKYVLPLLKEGLRSMGGIKTKYNEQDYISFYTNMLKIPVNVLNKKWNRHPVTFSFDKNGYRRAERIINDSNFLHFTGAKNKIQRIKFVMEHFRERYFV